MMHKAFIFFFLIATAGFGQVQVSPHSKLMFQRVAQGFVSELPPPPPSTIGTTYYDEEWLAADIFLKGETKLENVRVKLDLSSQNFEILHEGSIKILPGDRVLSFQWINGKGVQEAFVRGDYITSEGLKLTGFMKLLSDTEPYKLLEFATVEKLQANYNPQLDVGTKDHQIVKKFRTFIARDKLVLEVKGGKKKFITDFKEIFQTDVSTIVKEFNIDTRDDEELLVLLKQLNYSSPG
jgi:hypothetical protein